MYKLLKQSFTFWYLQAFHGEKTSLSQTHNFSFLLLSQNLHRLFGDGSLSVVILTTTAVLLKQTWLKEAGVMNVADFLILQCKLCD